MVKDIIDAYCQDESKTLIMVTHYEENLPKCITNKKEIKRTT
jgi:molybdate transport system ATP-binding protein